MMMPGRSSKASRNSNFHSCLRKPPNSLSSEYIPVMPPAASQAHSSQTYGIPTISRLLVKTNQLSSPKEATKRYADTTVLITEFTANPPTHTRTIEALARMNYIHGFYRKSGQISNDDMLYTLALFAVEPIKWITRYEWRK